MLLLNNNTKFMLKALKIKLPSKQINPDEINDKSELNSGTSAIVYLGTWNKTQVAIKEFKVNEEYEFNYEQEKSILTTLSATLDANKYIVKYYGCIKYGVNRAIVMEYMDNGDLLDYISQRNGAPFIESHILRFADEIAHGLNCMHRYEIIHCDLKCENILLNKAEHVKLCDFAFSKTKEFIETCTTLHGTPQYVAPELFGSDDHVPYSVKSDIYAYSVVLFMLANLDNTYLLQMTDNDIMELAFQNQRPGISSKCPSFVSDLIKRCWAQDPKLRPDTNEIITKIEERLSQIHGI